LKALILTALLIVIMTGSLACGEILEDKVRAHIERYGAGIDMSFVPADKRPNPILKKKGW
jgi:hypothetical protein